MDHAAGLAHGVERWRPPPAPNQVGVAIVLEDRHAIVLRQPEKLASAMLRHDGAGRILHGRDRVDVLRPDVAALEIGERRRQCLHTHAVLVERNADRLDAQAIEPRERALIGVLLDDNGVAACEQHAVDEVERLQGPRHDQNLVEGARNSGVMLELAREEFAQRAIALRAALQAIVRERTALAPQHRFGGRDQAVDAGNPAGRSDAKSNDPVLMGFPQPRSLSAFSRMASSVVVGVIACGSTLRWMIAGRSESCAALKAGAKSAVVSTVAPKPP